MLRRVLRSLAGRDVTPDAAPPAARPAGDAPADAPGLPAPLHRRVLMVVHDPVLETQGGQSLRVHFGWHDPEVLARSFIDDVRGCSYGYAGYEIAERLNLAAFPLKADGYRYDEQSYLAAWRDGTFHQPDLADYPALVSELGVIEKVNQGHIDEVWLFGFPYAGYYESIMGGPGAFWCNAPPLPGGLGCARRFVIMGFNYERGVGEMLENLGHRAESILARVFEHRQGDANLFARFTRYDAICPGCAECGNVHFAPNSQADYDWGNPRPVLSRCDTWYRFPDLSGEPRRVDCREWGNGDIQAHHRWWLRHLPHVEGSSQGLSWNWWEYIIDPDRVSTY